MKEEKKPKEQDSKKAELEKQVSDLTETLQRLQADTENYKKHLEKENAEFRKHVLAEAILRLLPVLDSFELALKNAQNAEQFRKGTEMIYAQLYDMLERDGLKAISALGTKFDPYRHEVMMTEKTDKEEEDDLVVEEFQKGYMFKDRVLRYSKVKVKKK